MGIDSTPDTPNKECDNEYRSLFWLPKLLDTADEGEMILGEMIGMIDDFYDDDHSDDGHSSDDDNEIQPARRRNQILGDVEDLEGDRTTVEVVPKSDETKHTILAILKSHYLFRQLHDYELDDVIDAMEEVFVEEGEEIISEGSEGDKFYVVEEGECEVLVGGKVMGPLNDDYFGDLALMFNSPRSATVRACTECHLWALGRPFFRHAMVNSSSQQHEAITTFLGGLTLFRGVDTESRAKMACSFNKMVYKDGDYIVREGEIGEHFFVIYSGEVKVTKNSPAGETELVRLGAGQVFGERALIRSEPRGANIIAVGEMECLTMSKQDFKIMLQDVVDQMNEINELRIVRAAPMFRLLSDRQVEEMCEKFEKRTLFKNQKLLCDPEIIFMVVEGVLVHTSSNDKYGVSKIIGTVSNGSGSVGCLQCEGDEAGYRSISRKYLVDALNSVDEDKISASVPATPGNFSVTKQKSVASKKRRVVVRTEGKLGPFGEVALQDLTLVKPLGRGTFGKVFQAEHKATGMTLALKCLDLRNIYKMKQQPYIIREAHSLQILNHQFISDYYGVILGGDNIFFMMEYVACGELWNLLYSEKNREIGICGGLKTEATAFYAGVILLALDHMHQQRIAYRDLKPENMLLSKDGYLKIIDFGFSKNIPFLGKSGNRQYRTYTLCGTPDYIAPEVVLTQGHDKGVDYWSFGVIIYEMMTLRPPFSANSQRRIFEKIVHSHKHLHFPHHFDAHAKSLVRRLLHPNPGLRFGNVKDGASGIKEHAFFSGNKISFDELESRAHEAPFIPKDEVVSEAASTFDFINLDKEPKWDPTLYPVFKNIVLNPLTMEGHFLDDDEGSDDEGFG